MGTRYIIYEQEKTLVYGDVFEEESVYIKVDNISNITLTSQKNKLTFEVCVDKANLKSFCENYLKKLDKRITL